MLRGNMGISSYILELNSETRPVNVSMFRDILKRKMRYTPTIKNIEKFSSYVFLWVFSRILSFDDMEILTANNESQTLDVSRN